jgi:hypothetical protein
LCEGGNLSGIFRALSLALALLIPGVAASPARTDTLVLTGVLQDPGGRPHSGMAMRVVLGSDPSPRLPDAGRTLVTDAMGRFALETDVTLRSRRVRLGVFSQPESRLLEIGFELDLLGQPALHWVEVDFIGGSGPLRGIMTFVAGAGGAFDAPLTFHSRDQSWSIPGDPSGIRLTGVGTDVRVETWDDSTPGRIELGLSVIHQRLVLQ